MLVLALALIVRIGAIAATPDVELLHDAREYDTIARSLADEGKYPPPRFARPDGPTALRTPAYPYLLGGTYAVTGNSLTAGRVVGALLGTVTVGLIALIAMRLWGPVAGIGGGLVAALYPPLVMMSASLVSEALFVPLILALVLLLVARGRPDARAGPRLAAAAGLLCGLAALTRPVGLVLLVPALLWAWRAPLPTRRRLAMGAVLLGVVALCIAPWTVRNTRAFDTLVPLSTQSGINLAGTYNPDSAKPGPSHGSWRPPFVVESLQPLYQRDYDEVELDRELSREGREFILENPTYPLEAISLNGLRIFGLGADRAGYERFWYGEMGIPERAQKWVRWSVYLMLVAAIVAAFVAGPARLRRAPLVFWITPVLLALSVIPIHGGPRYRLPVDPFLVLVVAAAIPVVVAWWRSRRARAPVPESEEREPVRDPEMAKPAAGGRFIAGDPLRAIAALSVVLFHVGLLTLGGRHVPVQVPEVAMEQQFGDHLGSALSYGNLGLYIFFVLSGYLIARPFVRAFVAGEALPDLPRYFRNRVLRVVPAFWLVFTVLLIRHGAMNSSFDEILAVYLFGQNYNESAVSFSIGQAWTLSVEMGFYLLVPLVAIAAAAAFGSRAGPRARLWAVLAGGAAVAILSLSYGGTDPASVALQRSLPATLFAFIPGVWLAAVEIVAAPRLRGREQGRLIALGLVAASAALLAVFAAIDHTPFRRYAILAAGISGTFVAAPLVLQWSTGRAWRLLDNRPLQWLGERSYSIYLVHLGVLLELGALARSGGPREGLALVLVAGTALTIVAATISHRLFEVPFLRLRKRWRRPRAGAGEPAAQPAPP
jgi:peptidoglycan/LPS O-acetylase OafA/YrhL